MKKIKLLFLASILFPFIINAQHDVKVNAIGIFFKNYGVGYEYIINEEMGAGIDMNIVSGNVSLFSSFDSNVKHSSFSLTPNFKFYFSPDYGADGFYFEGYLKYKNMSDKNLVYHDGTRDINYDMGFSGVALGIATGKKWVTNSGFYFETLFGFGRFLTKSFSYSDSYVEGKLKENNPSYESTLDFVYSWDLRFHLNVGWRFGGY